MIRTRIAAQLASVALVLTAGVLLYGTPAGAIQTTTWGIMAAPVNGHARAALDYPSNGQTVHDSVIVYNRTAQAIVVNLSVLGASYSNSAYQYTTPTAGVAAHTSLLASRIALGPHMQATVPFTVTLPRSSKVTTLAAIAAESSPVHEGSLLIQQQLVLLLKATPTTHSSPLVPDLGLWGPIAAVLLAGTAGGLAFEARRRHTRAPSGTFGLAASPA